MYRLAEAVEDGGGRVFPGEQAIDESPDAEGHENGRNTDADNSAGMTFRQSLGAVFALKGRHCGSTAR